jgi:hypothetical protein
MLWTWREKQRTNRRLPRLNSAFMLPYLTRIDWRQIRAVALGEQK